MTWRKKTLNFYKLQYQQFWYNLYDEQCQLLMSKWVGVCVLVVDSVTINLTKAEIAYNSSGSD